MMMKISLFLLMGYFTASAVESLHDKADILGIVCFILGVIGGCSLQSLVK